MFTFTTCRSAPTCTIPSVSANDFVLSTANTVTLKNPTEYLPSTPVTVSCTWPKDGAYAAITTPLTVTLTASQSCTPVAKSWSAVTATTGVSLSGSYTASTTLTSIVPNLAALFDTTNTAKCNGGKALSLPLCNLLTPKGSTTSDIISFATTAAAKTKDDSAVPIQAADNANGYNTTYALQCTWAKSSDSTITNAVPLTTVNSVWLTYTQTVLTAAKASSFNFPYNTEAAKAVIPFASFFTLSNTAATPTLACGGLKVVPSWDYTPGTMGGDWLVVTGGGSFTSKTNTLTAYTTDPSPNNKNTNYLGIGQNYTVYISCTYAADVGTVPISITSNVINVTIGASTTGKPAKQGTAPTITVPAYNGVTAGLVTY